MSDTAKKFDDRETATILAALRYWQKCLRYWSIHGLDEDGIASTKDTVTPLGDDEIDALCERIEA